MTFSDLPALNATLNGMASICLTLGYVFIKRQRKTAHRNCMIVALTCSTLFLISYITYHLKVGRTEFRDPPWFRPIYLVFLLTHTVLAVAVLPLVILTVRRAATGKFDLHKKIARWTCPIWMYVSVTGVMIYFLLYKIFPQH